MSRIPFPILIQRISIVITVAVIILLTSVFLFLGSSDTLLPGDVKLNNINTCRQRNSEWIQIEDLHRGEKVSICANLDAKYNPVQLVYYVFDEKDSIIYSESSKFNNGQIIISIPLSFEIGKYRFKVRWGRVILGELFFVVTK